MRPLGEGSTGQLEQLPMHDSGFLDLSVDKEIQDSQESDLLSQENVAICTATFHG